MINTVTIQGNFTTDPQLTKTAKDISVLNVRLACARDGRKSKQDADFIRTTFWGELAEEVAKKCKKGDNIIVRGHLESTPRNPKHGKPFTSLDLIVDYVDLITTRDGVRIVLAAEKVEA